MTLPPEQRRLLNLAREAEDGHLDAARGAVLRHFQQVNLRNAEKALRAALSQPAAQRRESLKGVLQLIGEASAATRTPPAELLAVMRRAVRDRVLNAQDLAQLSDPSLVFGDTRELRAGAVSRQRSDMNRYWAKEDRRFRDDTARTIREGIRKGLTPDGVADLLQERLGVHRSRAVLIAVDQTLTVASRAEQAVLRAAGVKAFQWYSLMDGKQRRSHELLHGKVFTWRSAPELPGAAVRCRCRATVPQGQALDAIRVPDALFARGQPEEVRQTMLEARRVADESGYSVAVSPRPFGGRGDSPAGFNRSTGIIYFNPKSEYWGNPQAFMEQHGPAGTGYLSSGHPMHVIYHEIAHGEHLKRSPVQYKDADRGWSLETRGALAVSGRVSRRAEADPREFVAEIRSALRAGLVYDEEVMRWYDVLGGPR